uniref:Uncharacterized protein n=1 Tax=Vitis vinifera TaxID=29760 RepID=A5BSU9_VITVI|nr:hypothetical protein VITISV_015118 [Vitis vinifera]
MAATLSIKSTSAGRGSPRAPARAAAAMLRAITLTLQQPAPRHHRDAAAGRVRRRREQDDAAAWREAPAVRTSFEGPRRSLSYPVPPSLSLSPEVRKKMKFWVFGLD